jgi:hypothetical protein
MTDLFLELIDFKLYVEEQDYVALMSKIKTLVAQKFHILG